MDCAEIRSGFVAGRVPANPEVHEHLQGCPSCRELFENDAALGRRLAEAVPPEVEPGDLFALVERDVQQETGLRARLRALPSPVRVGGLVSVALALLAFELRFNRRSDFAEFSPEVFWGVALVLAGGLAWGAARLARGPAAPLASAARERWLAVAFLVLPAIAVLVVPSGSGSPEAAAAWGHPGLCFCYGAALVAPFLLLYWLFERRDRVPLAALVSAGALAGVAANLLLHAHCPSAHLGHLLLGHASIGLAWALALVLFSKPLQPSR